MPLPIIQRADLVLALEDLLTSHEREDRSYWNTIARDRETLRDVRRCCTVLTDKDVRMALMEAARALREGNDGAASTDRGLYLKEVKRIKR